MSSSSTLKRILLPLTAENTLYNAGYHNIVYEIEAWSALRIEYASSAAKSIPVHTPCSINMMGWHNRQLQTLTGLVEEEHAREMLTFHIVPLHLLYPII